MKIYLTKIFKLQISFAGVDGCNRCRCTKLSPPYKGGISACTKYFFFFLFLASFFFLIDQILAKTQCLCDEDDLDFELEDDLMTLVVLLVMIQTLCCTYSDICVNW